MEVVEESMEVSKNEAPNDSSSEHTWTEQNLDNFGEFCFETDQLALKGNSDYQALIKTLVILEGQRMMAVQNMEKLFPLKEAALKAPLEFVEKLQRGENLDFPLPQKIAEIPEIKWSKYGVNTPENFTENPRPPSANNSENESKENERGKDGNLLVRGREFNQKKPETFNQLWTPEEQKRLEELLSKYPHERVEMERFRKIARELGNRTPLQVQSRVQKYFIKLQKLRLPVPGRYYNYNNYSHSRKSGHRQHQKHNRFLFPPSTFLASATPSVYMNEAEDNGECQSNSFAQLNRGGPTTYENCDVSDEDVPDSVKNSEAYAEIMFLKKLKKVKDKQYAAGRTVHEGYRCDHCGSEPIVGTRWHCPVCPLQSSTDICDQCIIQLSSKGGYHQDNHKLLPVVKAEPAPRQGTNFQ